MCSLASLAPPPFGRPAGVYPGENRGRNDDHQTFLDFLSIFHYSIIPVFHSSFDSNIPVLLYFGMTPLGNLSV